MLRSGWVFLVVALALSVVAAAAPLVLDHAPTANAAPVKPSDAASADQFGEEVMLPEQTIIFMRGSGNWESAYETLVDAFKNVNAVLDRLGLKPVGRPMTIYSGNDDAGFHFQAAVPIAEAPKNTPKGDIAIGTSPGGRALNFVNRGSYETIDDTYEAIVNFLDAKNLESRDVFVEEYVTDPVTTPEGELIINVYVPLQ
ncbi:MAG: GyrI-like domain-containing protein [Rhizobiales bacterium]|nr:GyrI-like domain-containing protein [Hyphomicrobiales bacterium]